MWARPGTKGRSRFRISRDDFFNYSQVRIALLYYGFSEQAMERMHMALRVSGGAHRGHNLDFFRQPLASMEKYKKVCFNTPCKVKNSPGWRNTRWEENGQIILPRMKVLMYYLFMLSYYISLFLIIFLKQGFHTAVMITNGFPSSFSKLSLFSV